MSEAEIAGWAALINVPTSGELDGTEPIDAPPPGFETWEHWRRHRWPAALG